MKTKNLKLPAILLAVLLVAYAIVTVVVGYQTKPTVSEGEFPFSITYEYLGETKTISGVYACKFGGSHTIFGMHERYWAGEEIYSQGDYIIYQDDTKTLSVNPGMSAGYFMGDPLERDYYQAYGLEAPTPYASYYDYENDIILEEYQQDEALAEIGFRFVDFSYGEPIENSFRFSGVSYEADNITFFVVLMWLFMIVCLIFVRKDKEYQYSYLDKSGIIVNFIVGVVAIPFIQIICTLHGLVGSGYEWFDEMIYNIPPIAILGLTLSIVLRRKEYRKTGFFIQFIGPVLFALVLILEQISLWIS